MTFLIVFFASFVLVFSLGYLLVRRMRWMYVGQYEQLKDILDEFIASSLEDVDFGVLLESRRGISLLNDLSNYDDEDVRSRAVSALADLGTDTFQKALMVMNDPARSNMLTAIYALEAGNRSPPLLTVDESWQEYHRAVDEGSQEYQRAVEDRMLLEVIIYYMSGILFNREREWDIAGSSSQIKSLRDYFARFIEERKLQRSAEIVIQFDYAYGELENNAFDHLIDLAKEEGIEYFLEIFESLATLFMVRSMPGRIEQLHSILEGFSEFLGAIYANEKSRGLPDQIESIFQRIFEYVEKIEDWMDDDQKRILELIAFHEIGNNLKLLAGSLERVYSDYR